MSKSEIQQLIDQIGSGGVLKLTPAKREFQGPAVIRQPLTIEGQSCTLWSEQGPVLVVQAGGVVLNGLNIELTGSDDQEGDAACALKVEGNNDVIFDHVSVRGNVIGLDDEEGEWRYPRSIRIGRLQPGHPHHFTAKLVIPVPCQFRSEIAGLSVTPAKSKGGAVKLQLAIDPLSPGTILRGAITIRTASLIRTIHVNANAPAHITGTEVVGSGQDVYAPDDWQTLYTGDDSTPQAVSLERSSKQSTKEKPGTSKKSRKPGTSVVTIPDRLETEKRPTAEKNNSFAFDEESRQALTKSPPAEEGFPSDASDSTSSSTRIRPVIEASIFGSASAPVEGDSGMTIEKQENSTTDETINAAQTPTSSVIPPPPPRSQSKKTPSMPAQSKSVVPPPPPKSKPQDKEGSQQTAKSILPPPPPKEGSTPIVEPLPEPPTEQPASAESTTKNSRREKKSGLGGAFE